MVSRPDGYIKILSIYRAYIVFHRLVIIVRVLDVLVKSPTVCNVASRKAPVWIDYNLTKNLNLNLLLLLIFFLLLALLIIRIICPLIL